MREDERLSDDWQLGDPSQSAGAASSVASLGLEGTASDQVQADAHIKAGTRNVDDVEKLRDMLQTNEN
jgi:hypothetical protein